MATGLEQRMVLDEPFFQARLWKDLWFVATTGSPKLPRVVVDFKLYEVHSIDPDDGFDFWLKTPDDGATKSFDEAELFAHGEVKWDGCSNWYFDIQNDVMIHCCGRQELVNLGEALARCHDWAMELLNGRQGGGER